MSTPDILPICTTQSLRGGLEINGKWCVPCYCMNCHKQFGYRNEPDASSGYVGYLCELCAETWSPLVGTMLVPDEVVGRIAAEEMIETHGRILTPAELARELDDSTTGLARLARSR